MSCRLLCSSSICCCFRQALKSMAGIELRGITWMTTENLNDTRFRSVNVRCTRKHFKLQVFSKKTHALAPFLSEQTSFKLQYTLLEETMPSNTLEACRREAGGDAPFCTKCPSDTAKHQIDAGISDPNFSRLQSTRLFDDGAMLFKELEIQQNTIGLYDSFSICKSEFETL